jgi:hypothetical protein
VAHRKVIARWLPLKKRITPARGTGCPSTRQVDRTGAVRVLPADLHRSGSEIAALAQSPGSFDSRLLLPGCS